ncbi:hypothetical protein ON05_020570 [Acaryochloris sp. CCMEE 5410]|nr:hypothetical protein ON05_020570 [Acaryochloris sp. CCMEE 5410]
MSSQAVGGRYRCAIALFPWGTPYPRPNRGGNAGQHVVSREALLLVIRHASSVVSIRFYRTHLRSFA